MIEWHILFVGGFLMKKLALCFIAFLGIFGSSAFADDRLYRFNQSDIDMIFHRDSAPLELAMLSPYEMQTTEGEWIQISYSSRYAPSSSICSYDNGATSSEGQACAFFSLA